MSKIQYAKLLAVLPIVAFAFVASEIGEADASGPHSGAKAKLRDSPQQAEPTAELSLMAVGELQKANPAVQSFKGFNEAQYDNTPTFRAVYLVENNSDVDVKNVEIQVNSDTETVQAELLGNLDPKHSVISVMIKAVNPDTISADIVGYEAR